MNAHYEFEVDAAYHQIWLEDERFIGSDRDFRFTDQHLSDRIWTDRNMIIMFTEREAPVPVILEICTASPIDELAAWDHVVEASLDVPSGRIDISGCGGNTVPPKESPVEVPPGAYRVRMYQRGLGALSEDGFEGDDHYKIALWLDPPIEPTVLKRWEPKRS